MYAELPTELIVKILQNLDLKEILRCRLVEKRFRDIVDSTPQLQYAIELAVAYCADNAGSSLGVTEKLGALRAREGAWKRARFGLGAALPYEYDWAYAGNVLQREFEFKALSAGADGRGAVAARAWTIDPGFLDFFLLETALDPARDVAVFLGMGKSSLLLHVVTLSTGAPLLDEPIQVLGPEMDDVQTTLRIHGPLAALVFVGVLASGAGDALPEGTEYSTVVHVYDIRRGVLLTTLTCNSGAGHSNARDLFGFISTSAFVLGSYVGGNYSLELHALLPTSGVSSPPPALPQQATHIATYRFPPIATTTFTTGWLLDEGSPGALGLPEPFAALPNAPMLAIKRAYMHEERARRGERITCVFAIPYTIFLDEVARAAAASGPHDAGAGPRERPWAAWGPEGTRCIPVPNDILMNPKASLTCHGFRLLVHEPQSSTLLDFNALDIARDVRRVREGRCPCHGAGTCDKADGCAYDKADGCDCDDEDVVVPPYPGRIILRPTTMPREFFTADVVTRLPYRETRVEWVGARPSRVVDGHPTLTVTGEPTGHGGLSITEYRVLVIDP